MEMSNKSDHELIERLNSGDMGVFREIYRKYSPLMQAFASRANAENLVQDVFMRIWVGGETITINESLQTYLFSAVRNRCINYLEHLKIKSSYKE